MPSSFHSKVMHEEIIRYTLAIAEKAAKKGNNPFGACLVKDGEILLEAENSIYTDDDSTKHAELNLVTQAAQTLGSTVLENCTLYTSNEPCAMCAGAIYWSGVRTVVFGCSNYRLEKIAGKSISMSCRDIFDNTAYPVHVIGPILEDEAERVHTGHWSGNAR